MTNTRICKQAYEMLLKLSDQGHSNWVNSVRNLLCTNGLGVVWLFKQVGNEKIFLNQIKNKSGHRFADFF